MEVPIGLLRNWLGELMPLCPNCGHYYMNKCECGYSAVEALDQISRESSTARIVETDEGERALSVERRRIYEFLSSLPDRFTVRQIAEETDVSESTVRKSLQELSEEGSIISGQSPGGKTVYGLTETGYTRFRYGSDALTAPRDEEKLYVALKAISEPVTVKEIIKRSGVSEYLVRKAMKFLEEEGEVVCEDRDARPRKFTIKAGPMAVKLLKPRKFFRDAAPQEDMNETGSGLGS